MKQILRIILALVYLAVLLFALVVMLKPGAAVFYWKSQIRNEDIIQGEDVFKYEFKGNFNVYSPDTLLVIEDQKVLEHVANDLLLSEKRGTYTLAESSETEVTVLFRPSVESDPSTNGHVYSIYARPYLLSSNWGGKVFLLLLLGVIGFFWTGFVHPQKRKVLFGSPFGAARLWFGLIDRPVDFQTPAGSKAIPVPRLSLLKHSAIRILLIAFFYIFMEWVFFVTKPSFMEILPPGEKVKIFLITGLIAALLSLLALPIIFLIDIAVTPILPSFRKYAYHLPLAFLGACLGLILADNFTYTVFKFGIFHSKTLLRLVYGLAFVVLFSYILRAAAASTKSAHKHGANKAYTVPAFVLLVPSLVLAGFSFERENLAFSTAENISGVNSKPNIILLSTDGLNAENMSIYGYERETTPFIRELARTSLVSENNFTNAAHSMGSDTALLTGTSPFETRVLFPPDTLKGPDTYQHLPGILKREGYRTVSLGVPYYVDANTINFLNAFDAVNCQETDPDGLSVRLSGYGFDDAFYLLSTVEKRAKDRLRHIFFIEDMENPIIMVTKEVSDDVNDIQRLQCLRSYLETASKTRQPLFAHVHLMATHGAKFSPAVQVFSKNKNQDQDWMTDFYDDAILNFDMELQQLVAYMKELDLYENTILVLYSDHGKQYSTIKKLPLIFRFPNGQQAGTITANTQNLDVAPTVLDYIGIQKPEWMTGSSLLRSIDPKRLIIAGRSNNELNSQNRWQTAASLSPPFYQFSELTVIQCHKAYVIDLVDITMDAYDVESYRNACSNDILDSQDAIREKVGDILLSYGYLLPEYW